MILLILNGLFSLKHWKIFLFISNIQLLTCQSCKCWDIYIDIYFGGIFCFAYLHLLFLIKFIFSSIHIYMVISGVKDAPFIYSLCYNGIFVFYTYCILNERCHLCNIISPSGSEYLCICFVRLVCLLSVYFRIS